MGVNLWKNLRKRRNPHEILNLQEQLRVNQEIQRPKERIYLHSRNQLIRWLDQRRIQSLELQIIVEKNYIQPN